jgi:hypothetical protein
MKSLLEEYLNFINKCSIEPTLLWTTKHLYDKSTYQIKWILDKKQIENFFIKKTEDKEEIWLTFTAKELVDFLNKQKVDLYDFEFQVLKTICIQAVCSHYYIKRAEELVGKDRIETALTMVTSLKTETKPKIPRLKLIDKKQKKKVRGKAK